jgi:hypothetical protein
MKILKLGQMLGGSNAPSGGYENLYSLDFDGVDDYVNCGDDASLRPTTAMSVNIWFKLADNESSTTMRIIGNWTDSGFFIRWDAKRVQTFLRVNGASQVNKTGFNKFKSGQHYFRANGWHMATLTFDGQFINLYIDGALENSGGGIPTVDLGSTGNTIDQLSTDMIFARHTSLNSQFWSGLLDEASIFGRALTPAEISEYWNSGTPTNLSGESNLLGYWRNGDTAGASVYPTIEDYSSNSNDGTMTNMVSGDIVTDVP